MEKGKQQGTQATGSKDHITEFGVFAIMENGNRNVPQTQTLME